MLRECRILCFRFFVRLSPAINLEFRCKKKHVVFIFFVALIRLHIFFSKRADAKTYTYVHIKDWSNTLIRDWLLYFFRSQIRLVSLLWLTLKCGKWFAVKNFYRTVVNLFHSRWWSSTSAHFHLGLSSDRSSLFITHISSIRLQLPSPGLCLPYIPPNYFNGIILIHVMRYIDPPCHCFLCVQQCITLYDFRDFW